MRCWISKTLNVNGGRRQPLCLLPVVLLHLNVLTFNVFVFACGVRGEEKVERIWNNVVKYIDINVWNNSQGVVIKI